MFIDTIGFDADDTLWHNESLYAATQERFRELLATYHSPQRIDLVLYETEMRNLHRFGYGIKRFTLSMIEAAIELTEGKIEGWQIQTMIDYANEMLLAKHAIPPDRFLMVGNSLRSDVLPVLEIGGTAVHIPYQITWQHEDVELQPDSDGAFMRLETMHQLPDLLAQLAAE